MFKIGITGGIGAGKTIICDLLINMGYPVYNSDIKAKNLCNESSSLIKALKDEFGENLYKNNILDKKLFATLIFNDPKKLQRANQIIHPFVREDFNNWTEKQVSNIVFIESAILLESDLREEIDSTITISAPEDIKIKRVMDRDNTSQEEIIARINNQMSESDRINKANHLIINDNKTALIPQIERILSLFQ